MSHSNDGEFDTDPRLVKVPAADHPPNSRRNVYFSPESFPRYVGYDRQVPEYFPRKLPPGVSDPEGDASSKYEDTFVPLGSIPQVPHTFAYLEDTYGAVNEHQVGIGESTCSGIFGAIPLSAPNGTALFSVDQLTQLAMERTTSAREAILLMGDLAVQHGFYGAGEFEGTAESLGVTDTEEAWVFHILPDPTGESAIWAAQKIPDDGFAVLANMFVIREVDPSDTENFLMSDSVHSVARDYGWWKSVEDDGLLDFTKIYSDGEYAHKFYSGRRMWGAYHLACPSRNFPSDYVDLQSDPVYPVSSRPDEKLSLQDLFRFHRYTYQGTEFDLGGDQLAAGPFGSPDRWKEGPGEQQVKGNWERSIGLYRTSDTYVVQSKSSHDVGHGGDNNSAEDNAKDMDVGAVLWYAPSSPLGSVFTPFLVHLSDIPTSFRSGHQQIFDRKSAFWAACFVSNIANLKWSYAIKDIEARQALLENASIEMVNQMKEQFIHGEFKGDFRRIEEAYLENVEKIVTSLWSLSDEIMFKYASGFVNVPPDHMSQMVGYPVWWLKAVGFEDGPPPPPTKPKCCHPNMNGGTEGKDATFLRKQNKSDQNLPMPLTGKAAMKHHLKMQQQWIKQQ